MKITTTKHNIIQRKLLPDEYDLNTVGPADIVSIEDAAPLPVEGLIVEVEPVQDLHGYENPWPAGGGVNKLAPLTGDIESNGITVHQNSNGSVTINGTTTNTFFIVSNPFDVVANTTYNVYIGTLPSGADNYGLAGFGNQKTIINNSDYRSNGVQIFAPTGTTFTNAVVWPMIAIDTMPTSFSPYSNICPITGWEGCEVKDEGKNLFDNVYADYTKPFDYMICPVELEQGKQYTVKGHLVGTAQSGFTLGIAKTGTRYTEFGGFITVLNGEISDRNLTFTVDSAYTDPKLIIYCANEAAFDAVFENYEVQLELGSTPTAYEPYKSRTVSASFPETLYGGTVDLATGEVKVDRAGELLRGKMFSINWMRLETTLSHDFLNANRDQSISSAYSYNIQVLGGSYTNYNGCFGMLESGRRLLIYDERYTTTASIPDFLEEMGDTMIVYPLATPITFTLTPAELELFKGTNNISADAGQVTVTYPQNSSSIPESDSTGTLHNIVYLSNEQADTLFKNGSITSNGNTVRYSDSDLYIAPSNNPDILSDTTANWSTNASFIPEKGQIIIYTDKDGLIPGIKIGDGLAYGIDLPFVGDDIAADLLSHINNTTIHITAEERVKWDNKLNCNDNIVNETLILTRD